MPLNGQRLLLKWPSLHMHFCLNELLKQFSSIMLTSGVNTGPQGPQLREDPGRKGPERGPFSSNSARWRLEAHFLDPTGGPKFEVTPLVLTLFSCFKKIHFTPPVVRKIKISSQNDSICIRSRHLGSWNKVVNPSDK